MNIKMNAAAYAKSFETLDKVDGKGKDEYREMYEEGVIEAEQANVDSIVDKHIGFEEKFVVLFQKFLVYSTGIAVGIIIINLLYILLFGGAEILEVVSNIFAAVAMVAINERIR